MPKYPALASAAAICTKGSNTSCPPARNRSLIISVCHDSRYHAATCKKAIRTDNYYLLVSDYQKCSSFCPSIVLNPLKKLVSILFLSRYRRLISYPPSMIYLPPSCGTSVSRVIHHQPHHPNDSKMKILGSAMSQQSKPLPTILVIISIIK